MSVARRKLPSGRVRYEVRWRENGRNRSRLFDRRPDAVAFDDEIRRFRQAGDLAVELQNRRLTIDELARDWWERRAVHLSPRTVEQYARILDKRLLPALGDQRVTRLRVRDVEHWLADLRAAGVGDPSIIKACTALQSILTLAVADGIVAVNVARDARKPRQGRTRIPYVITLDQVEDIRQRFLHAGRERDVVLLELLAYAGLRPESEALVLPWQHVRARSLLVVDTKRHRERTVTLLEPLRETLVAWRLRRGAPAPELLVVPNNSDNAWADHDWDNWRDRIFRPAAVAAGLPADVRPRDLRGSLVSLLVHEGRSIREVANELGHSPEVCLRDYAQVLDGTTPDERVPAAQAIRQARALMQRRYALSSHDQADTTEKGAQHA